jgi:hypothetical protein
LAGSSQFDRASRSKEPAPEFPASKLNERLDWSSKVISIFHCPFKSEDCGRAASTEQMYAAKSKISISPILIIETSSYVRRQMKTHLDYSRPWMERARRIKLQLGLSVLVNG